MKTWGVDFCGISEMGILLKSTALLILNKSLEQYGLAALGWGAGSAGNGVGFVFPRTKAVSIVSKDEDGRAMLVKTKMAGIKGGEKMYLFL